MPTDDTEDSIDTPDEHRQVFLGMEPADDGEPVPWGAIDDPDAPDSICQHVVRDREQRVDDGMLMADRPPVAIFTIDEYAGEIVRVEYYWGHDRLGLEYDLRADPDADPEPTLGGGA